MSFVTREEASMLEAEQPEEQNCEESGCEAKEELSLNSARRGCGRWRRGGLGSLRGPGRRRAGSWWRRAEDQQAPEGPGF